MTTPMKEPLIYSKIPTIMAKVGVVKKDRKNAQQGYNFRGIDDMYNALNEHLSAEKVFAVCTSIANESVTERESKSGSAIFSYSASFTWRFYAEDGSFVETTTIGKGMDSGDKDTNKAMSVAYKYAMMQTFCIPTEEDKDPEVDDHHVKPTVQKSISDIATGPQCTNIITNIKKKGLSQLDVFNKWGIESKELLAIGKKTKDTPLTKTEANTIIKELLAMPERIQPPMSVEQEKDALQLADLQEALKSATPEEAIEINAAIKSLTDKKYV
jgi:hypothetical protein